MTENDWLLLSEWLDGGLDTSARAAFEARLATEPSLAEAARRLQTLEVVARRAGPTNDDRSTWSRRPSPIRWLGVVLLLAAGAGLWALRQPPAVLQAAGDGGVQLAMVQVGLTLTTPAPDDVMPPAERADASAFVSPNTEPGASPAHDTAQPHPGASPMPLRPDASAVAAVTSVFLVLAPSFADAGAIDAGPLDAGAGDAGQKTDAGISTRLTLRRGETSLFRATVSAVRPPGIVRAVQKGWLVDLEGLAVGSAALDLARDGGVTVLEVDVIDEVSQPQTVTLKVGGSRKVFAPGRVRWSLGDTHVVKVVELESVLELTALAAGETTLESWFEDGSHRTWPIVVEGESLVISLGRPVALQIMKGSPHTVTPPEALEVKPLGDSLLLSGRRAGAGSISFTTRKGEKKTLALVVNGVDLSRAQPSRRLRWSELRGLLRMTRGEVVLITPEVEPVGVISGRITSLLKNAEVLITSQVVVEDSLSITLPDGSVRRLIVIVDP